MKTCSKCGVEKPFEDFPKAARGAGGRHSWCKICHTKWRREWEAKNPEKRRGYGRAYYQRHREKLLEENKKYRERRPEVARAATKRWEDAHPEYQNQKAAKYRQRNRYEVFIAYGGFRCACCGETEPMFMTIDHVNNDGAQHRRAGATMGSAFFAWLRSKGFPSGFQVLCRNCNWGKHANGGVCPHQSSEGSSTIPLREYAVSD